MALQVFSLIVLLGALIILIPTARRCLRQEGRRVGLDNWARAAHAGGMADSLKARVKEKMLRQLAEDGRHPIQEAEGDDPRLVSINDDLEALEQAEEGDPIVEETGREVLGSVKLTDRSALTWRFGVVLIFA